MKPATQWVEFISPSTLRLQPFVKLLLEPINDRKIIEQLQLGLHEALINSVKHGNSMDQDKLIRVRRILTPNWLVFQIQDKGNGIPIGSRTNKLPSKLDAESGRGLYLIHQCFDDVRWSKQGNRLQVAFRR